MIVATFVTVLPSVDSACASFPLLPIGRKGKNKFVNPIDNLYIKLSSCGIILLACFDIIDIKTNAIHIMNKPFADFGNPAMFCTSLVRLCRRLMMI